MEKPKKLELDELKLKELTHICQKYIDFIDDDKKYTEDNDFDQYIFECALETIFGKKVWDFVNKRQK